MRKITCCAFILIVCSIALAQENLGTLTFPVTGKEEAIPHFLKGVLLLHSFEYPDALEAFEEAIRIDPDFVMAYWGAAMTHTHPIWMEQDQDAAIAILKRLATTREARLQKAKTAREKAWLETLEVLYGDGTKKERDFKYEKAMENLAITYPEDGEAAIFHALSILGTAHSGRDFRIYMRAAGILEQVYEKLPQHPGVLHYMIHCYDDPVHATLGLRPARKYAKVAPAAAHAQHMPSHIFLALGMWDDVVSSNAVSWKVADERVHRKKLDLNERGYHALYWLEYGYLQQGRFEEARKMLAIMEEDAKKSPTSRILWHLVRMRAAYIIETQTWDGDVVAIEVDLTKLRPNTVVVHLFAGGYAAVKRGDLPAANKHLVELKKQMEQPQSAAEESHHAMASYGSIEKKTMTVMRDELQAAILFAEGKKEQAVAMMKKAAEEETGLTFEFGPPEIVKPSHEMLGEMLLEMGKSQEAQSYFQIALDRAPGRALSLKGLSQNAKAQRR